jgi:hypothetical protein
MSGLQQAPVAKACIAGGYNWKWDLRLDERGLFRWYMDGVVATHLRGCSRELAESALRRFVATSLKGELRITDCTDRIGPDSERPRAASTATA